MRWDARKAMLNEKKLRKGWREQRMGSEACREEAVESQLEWRNW
jgi:hypothetical protein